MDNLDRRQLEAKISKLESEIRVLKSRLHSHRKLETQLYQAQKMEALAALSGGIAHDFNNILHCILGYTELALLNKDADNPDYDNLKDIEAMINKGRDLADQLLAFGRKIEPQLAPLDLNQKIRDVVKILGRTIPRMIEIELHLAENLDTIVADAGQCEQILMNLCINAKDAMPEGGKLTLKTENIRLGIKDMDSSLDLQPGNYVRLTVSDSGHGMDQKTLDHIYDPFFTTKERGKGSGLGLSSVYAIVMNHHGFIECESRPNSGSTFRICLPVGQPFVRAPQPVAHPGSSDSCSGSESVLIIDDEEDILRIGENFLKRNNYEVWTAQSGEEGVAIFKSHKIDVVLLDVSMPGIGGVGCLKEIQSHDPEARVIIISGYTANGRVKEAIRQGAKAYLAKPYGLQELVRTIRSVLDESSF